MPVTVEKAHRSPIFPTIQAVPHAVLSTPGHDGETLVSPTTRPPAQDAFPRTGA